MIGSYAIFGDEIFFSETLLKKNMNPCHYPLENWLQPSGHMFIPLATHAVKTSSWFDTATKNDMPSNVNLPLVCGLSIHPNRYINEIALKDGNPTAYDVPWGPGTIYTRSIYSEQENALYAALLLTGNLKEAVNLASESITTLRTGHIFSNISICAYAAYKKDLSLIRTMTRQDMEKIVIEEIAKNKY